MTCSPWLTKCAMEKVGSSEGTRGYEHPHLAALQGCINGFDMECQHSHSGLKRSALVQSSRSCQSTDSLFKRSVSVYNAHTNFTGIALG